MKMSWIIGGRYFYFVCFTFVNTLFSLRLEVNILLYICKYIFGTLPKKRHYFHHPVKLLVLTTN